MPQQKINRISWDKEKALCNLSGFPHAEYQRPDANNVVCEGLSKWWSPEPFIMESVRQSNYRGPYQLPLFLYKICLQIKNRIRPRPSVSGTHCNHSNTKGTGILRSSTYLRVIIIKVSMAMWILNHNSIKNFRLIFVSLFISWLFYGEDHCGIWAFHLHR